MKDWSKAGDLDTLADLFEFEPPRLPNKSIDEAPDLPQNSSTGVRNNEKECPFCSEIVKKEAIFCKHCKSNIDENINENPTYNPPKTVKQSNPLGALVKYIIVFGLLYFAGLGFYEHFALDVKGALGGGIGALVFAFIVLLIPTSGKSSIKQTSANKKSDYNGNYDGVSMAMHQIGNDIDDYSD